jgi:hypothetical protein
VTNAQAIKRVPSGFPGRDTVLLGGVPKTHEFISIVLGVCRPQRAATGMLQRAGLIHYSRGRMRIIDHPGLRLHLANATTPSDMSLRAYSVPGPGRSNNLVSLSASVRNRTKKSLGFVPDSGRTGVHQDCPRQNVITRHRSSLRPCLWRSRCPAISASVN